MKNPPKSYQQALEELQQIVQELQQEMVSVDDISEKSARAADLVKWCQEKLTKTEKHLDQLF